MKNLFSELEYFQTGNITRRWKTQVISLSFGRWPQTKITNIVYIQIDTIFVRIKLLQISGRNCLATLWFNSQNLSIELYFLCGPQYEHW